MNSPLLKISIGLALAASLAACGGGGGAASTSPPPIVTPQSVSVPLLISDASSEDWATIGVKVLSVSLTPQGGGTPVTIYTAPSPAPMVNLVQLDQLSELLGSVSIAPGTYSTATVTVSANPGDVNLVVAADPEAGFGAAAGTVIPASQIQIQNAKGSTGSLTTDISLKLDKPLTVSSSQSTALDLEFDLSHPAFINVHVPPGAGSTIWAVNFNGPMRQHGIDRITDLVLRHAYGTVSAISSDGANITIAKDVPAIPVQSPEVAVATGQSLTILADATNGTIFYDVDAKTVVTIKDFKSESSLSGKYVRVAARYQQDGTLVATRIWASSTFNSVWVGPEGHVLHVDTTNNIVTVANEAAQPVALTVDANTQFFFHAGSNPTATPIGTGPAFLAAHDLVRGFKVHASVVDPLAATLVAQTIDIETATYDGKISASDLTGLTYTRQFGRASDDYTVMLDYISDSTANGKDASGNAITGFKYWNFAYPSNLIDGSTAKSDFVAATSTGVNFGGTVGSLLAAGVSHAVWGDAANPTGWSAPFAVLMPMRLPRATVASALSGTSFTISVAGGTTPATVDISTTSGSATLVYQIDRTNNIVTVTPEDITTSAGLTALTNGLAVGAPVRVSAVPQADGTLKAYVITYFTGDKPTG